MTNVWQTVGFLKVYKICFLMQNCFCAKLDFCNVLFLKFLLLKKMRLIKLQYHL